MALAVQKVVLLRAAERRTIRGNGSSGVRCERSRAHCTKKYVARRNVAVATVGAAWARMEKRTDRQRKWGADGVGMVQDAEREMGAADYCTHGDNVKRGCGVP